jgi:hypothetical protein
MITKLEEGIPAMEEVIALATTAANTVVVLMVTDSWHRARSAVKGLWQRVRPAEAEQVEQSLESARGELLSSPPERQLEISQRLSSELAQRIAQVVGAEEAPQQQLRELVEQLGEQLGESDGDKPANRAAGIKIETKTSGHGKTYVLGQGEMRIG